MLGFALFNNMWKLILIGSQMYISRAVLTQELSSECIDRSKKAELEACCSFPRPIPEGELLPCVKKYLHLVKDHTNYIVCLSDCQSVGLGYLKDNGVDMEAFRKLIQNIEPVAKDTIDRVAQMCIRVIGEQKAAIARAGTKCSAMAFAFFKCLGEKVFANCPDKYWSSSEICTKHDKGVTFCEKN